MLRRFDSEQSCWFPKVGTKWPRTFATEMIAKRRRVPQKQWGWISVMGKAIIGSYDFRLVALSILIAVFASFAALDLAGRTTVASGRIRLVWLAGGAIAMGVGIWSMGLSDSRKDLSKVNIGSIKTEPILHP